MSALAPSAPEDFAERALSLNVSPNARHINIGHTTLVDFHDETEAPGKLVLTDLTNLPRFGLRGKNAAAYLTSLGLNIPDAPNKSALQADGSRLLRLSQGEFLFLGSLSDFGAAVRTLEQAFPPEGKNGVYGLPRQDTHAWFWLAGPESVDALAKLCGVDLSPKAFAPDAIAQTSVAHINAIIVNAGNVAAPAFHLLPDRPSAGSFEDAVVDALQEFGGRKAGLRSLGL